MKLTEKNKFIQSILHSYSQIFFAENSFLAIILILVSFFNPWAGLFGLLSVIFVNATAFLLNFNKTSIQKGLYGFNALLTGLGAGIIFEPNFTLFVVILSIALLTLFFAISLQGILGKYGLPFLSIPFILGMWILILSTDELTHLNLTEKGIFVYNELFQQGGLWRVKLYESLNNLDNLRSIKIYFISLSAIIFQNDVLAGILIALGLLYYSRISFALSILGFYLAYLFYLLIGANFSELSYTFIGFNYILTAIAIGGYFFIPSKKSFFWLIILLPVTVLISLALKGIFDQWKLPIYSLPFNIVVLLFLYVMKWRSKKPEELTEEFIKLENPEKSLYLYHTLKEILKNKLYYPISLPFAGEWTVLQSHNGKYTHKDLWRYAWDFIITDENGKSFQNNGDYPADYYCYDKPVYAPADGYIINIVDGIHDNIIGETNTVQNWGNSIVIKHTEYLYTQLSHLKAGSIRVKNGDFVKKGTLLATVGNSGYSPYPHLHFQIQSLPYVGSATLDYPLYNFIVKKMGKIHYFLFGKPKENDKIAPAIPHEILKKTLNLVPGKILQVINEKNETEQWKIDKNIYNQAYIYDKKSNSYLYFYSNETGFYINNFVGDKNSNLFEVYKALNSIYKVFYKNLEVNNILRPDYFFSKEIMFIQDFLAPFWMFIKVKFQLQYKEVDDEIFPNYIKVKSKVKRNLFSKEKCINHYEITFWKNEIIQIKDLNSNQEIKIEVYKSIWS